jgi:hypothetical protein
VNGGEAKVSRDADVAVALALIGACEIENLLEPWPVSFYSSVVL